MEPPRLPGTFERDVTSRTRVSIAVGTLIGLAIGLAYVVHLVGGALVIR